MVTGLEPFQPSVVLSLSANCLDDELARSPGLLKLEPFDGLKDGKHLIIGVL